MTSASPSVYRRCGRLATHYERNDNHVIIIILQGHLSLEITDVMFEALSGLHFDCEEVIAVLLKLPSGRVLVIKGPLHLFETLK